MSQKGADVGKPRILLASRLIALERTLVLVHVLIPLTEPSEYFILVTACLVSTDDLAILISRRLSLWTSGIRFYGVAWRGYKSGWCHRDVGINSNGKMRLV